MERDYKINSVFLKLKDKSLWVITEKNSFFYAVKLIPYKPDAYENWYSKFEIKYYFKYLGTKTELMELLYGK
jgi:hypothetical protein